MVIDYLYLVSVAFFPGKADPALVVDPDAVLPSPIPDKLLEAVARWDAKIR